ncbi:hypothetical protein V5O48_019398, partial [Marasmius crinis-equi]
ALQLPLEAVQTLAMDRHPHVWLGSYDDVFRSRTNHSSTNRRSVLARHVRGRALPRLGLLPNLLVQTLRTSRTRRAHPRLCHSRRCIRRSHRLRHRKRYEPHSQPPSLAMALPPRRHPLHPLIPPRPLRLPRLPRNSNMALTPRTRPSHPQTHLGRLSIKRTRHPHLVRNPQDTNRFPVIPPLPNLHHHLRPLLLHIPLRTHHRLRTRLQRPRRTAVHRPPLRNRLCRHRHRVLPLRS